MQTEAPKQVQKAQAKKPRANLGRTVAEVDADQGRESVTRDAATIKIDDFVAKVMANRNKPEPKYVMPPVPPRIAEQTRLEMEHGAKRVAEAAAQQANRPVPKRDPAAGTMTPVFRPKDFVPNMNQGQLQGKVVASE